MVRPDGGRKALVSTAGNYLEAITSAWASNIEMHVPVVYRAANGKVTPTDNLTVSRYQVYNSGGYTYIDTLDGTTVFPTGIVGALVVKNADGRTGSAEFGEVVARVSAVSIKISPQMTVGDKDKFTVFGSLAVDLRGFMLSDGSRFILHFDGTSDVLFDLNDVTLYGTRWEAAHIGQGSFMVVTPTKAPRILAPAGSVYSQPLPEEQLGVPRLAGLIPLRSPLVSRVVSSGPASSTHPAMDFYTEDNAARVLTPSLATRLKLRLINAETGAQSEFVDLYNVTKGDIFYADASSLVIGIFFADGGTTSTSELTSEWFSYYQYLAGAGDKLVLYGPASIAGEYTITGKTGGAIVQVSGTPWSAGISCAGQINTRMDEFVRGVIRSSAGSENLAMPLDSKATHVEVWRTDAAGATFYLENVIELTDDKVDTWQPTPGVGVVSGSKAYLSGLNIEDAARPTCFLTDDQLAGQTPLLAADIKAGRLPPACRQVISIRGVTVCLGASSESKITETIYARSFYMFGASYSSATKRITASASYANSFANYTWQAGDQWVFANNAEGLNLWTPLDIESKVSSTVIQLTAGDAPAANRTVVKGYILRPHAIDWPRIEDDELLYHSRTDMFAPESFMSSPVRLSSEGDLFRRAVVAGGVGVVVMHSGVHILVPTADGLTVETVGTGIGTPWADSVVTFNGMVFWATCDGPRAIAVSYTPNDSGRRWQEVPIDGGRMRGWFEAARVALDDVDAGVDPGNSCVRFRRKPVSDPENGTALQVCLLTGRWTVINGDSGLRYVTTRFADDDNALEERLYSIGSSGSIFEENYYRSADRYPSLLSKGTINTTDLVLTVPSVGKHRITRSGSQDLFSTTMLDDVVWFTGENQPYDRTSRRITAVTANYIEFATVTGLAAGGRFIVGGVRMRLRTAPLGGADVDDNVKQIAGIRVDGIPGDGDSYEPIRVNAYESYGSTPLSSDDVDIFDDADAGMKTKDRMSGVEAAAADVQLEIDQIDVWSDWHLRRAHAIVKEEGTAQADATT